MTMPARGLPAWLRVWLLAAIPVIVVGMTALGFWQLSRLQDRRARNALLSTRLAEAPVAVTPALIGADLAVWDNRPALARGVFDPAQEIIWRNQARNGAPGVHVITPLRLADGQSAILVDRGWIPYTQAEPAARAVYAAPPDIVVITGVLRLPALRNFDFLPADPPLSAALPRVDAWYWLDITQIQVQVPYPVLPWVLAQTSPPAGAPAPVPDYSVDLSDGPHFLYALQWFAFAAIAFFGPLIYWRQNRRTAGIK